MALEAQDNPFPYITLVDTADPTTPAAGTKRLWVDTDDTLKIIDESAAVTTIGGAVAASAVTFTPNGSIAATDVQAAIQEVRDEAAGGSVATDTIWDAAGDLVQGTGANTSAKLTAGTAGMFLKSAGAAAANLWAFPPGYEIDYAQITSPVNITATSEATANTVITGAAVAYDGSTVVMLDVYFPYVTSIVSQVRDFQVVLYDGSSAATPLSLQSTISSASTQRIPYRISYRFTPSAATHTYSIRANNGSAGTVVVGAGTPGSGAIAPAFMRITKV